MSKNTKEKEQYLVVKNGQKKNFVDAELIKEPLITDSLKPILIADGITAVILGAVAAVPVALVTGFAALPSFVLGTVGVVGFTLSKGWMVEGRKDEKEWNKFYDKVKFKMGYKVDFDKVVKDHTNLPEELAKLITDYNVTHEVNKDGVAVEVTGESVTTSVE